MTTRILVTGAQGMVGRNVMQALTQAGQAPVGIGRSDLNLLNQAEVFQYLQTAAPEWVIHCAGRVGGIQANMSDLAGYLSENLEMGKNIILASQQAGVPRLINLGSSCMYPRDLPGMLTEDLLLSGPLEPTNEGYALAKIVCERLCRYITSQSGGALQYKTLIPCNLYGRWDKFDPERSHLLPAIIHKIHQAITSKAETVEIWGNGEARREFLYSGDLAQCILRALTHFDTLPQTLNVGTGQDHTINELYQMAADAMGYQGRFVHDLSKPVGMQRKLLDVTPLAQWGWQANTPLTQGIRETYEYYGEAVAAKS